MKFKMTIKKQVITALVLVGMIPYILVSIISYVEAKKALKKEAFEVLTVSKELKKDELKLYFGMLIKSLNSFSDNKDVKSFYHELLLLHDQYKVDDFNAFNIIQTQEVKDIFAKYDSFFKSVITGSGIQDIYLTCAAHGHVMYTYSKGFELGENIQYGSLKNTLFAKAWRETIKSRQIYITDIGIYEPSNNKPAMFISIPVFEKNKTIAAFIVKVDIAKINQIMSTRIGIGKTGETYLVGKDYLMRSDSYIDPQNRSLESSLLNSELGTVKTVATQEALLSISNTKILNDYRGKSVLASYSPFVFKDIKWAFVAQIDTQEIFEPIETLKQHMIILGLISFIVVVLVAMWLSSLISRPIAQAIKTMIDSNSQVVNASNEINNSSNNLAEGASEQASSVEQVSAAVEESTAIIEQNAQSAKKADELAKRAKESASKGYEKGGELIVAMEDINDSSEKIAHIIQTINEIASQTKLLALNAAVEAARAGEYGLGFAVVADEVKNLAQISTQAANETAKIIEESITQVAKGSAIAQESNQAFQDILDRVENASQLITEISISTKEHSEGMSQIASSIGEIEHITQQNAATSEEGAASAEQLNAQAISMQEIVNRIGTMVGHKYNASYIDKKKKAEKKDLSNQVNKNYKEREIVDEEEIFPLDRDDLKDF